MKPVPAIQTDVGRASIQPDVGEVVGFGRARELVMTALKLSSRRVKGVHCCLSYHLALRGVGRESDRG